MNRLAWTPWMFVGLALLDPRPCRAQAPPPVRLTLEEAIDRSLGASHRVEEARARAEAAEAVVAQRHSALLPRIGAQAGFLRTNHIEAFGIQLPNNQLRIIYPDIPDNYRTRLDAQWPVYTGGRLQALERAARTELAAVDHDRAALQSDVRADVARAYWSLVAADASIEVLDRAIARVDAHLRDARNRLAAGVVAPNDVTSAEAQLARQRMLRIQAGANRDIAEAALARLVGVAPGTGIETATPVDGAATAVPGFDDLLTEARERRADRRALDTRVSAAGLRRDAAAAGRRPTVAVAAGVDYARPNPRIFPRQGSWRESWDAGINVDWPLFDGGRARAETAEAAAAQRAAEARLAEFDALLALEIRRRLSELTAGRAAIDAADAEIAAATETHRVAAERFAAGVATSTDVLDAQLTILQAGLDRTQAAVAVRLAEADLARAVGRERP